MLITYRLDSRFHFSLKSPCLVISSWFLLARSKSATAINPHSTKQGDGKLVSFLPCRSTWASVFLFTFLGQPHRGSFDLEKSFHYLSCCNPHKSCWHCSDTADKSLKSGWVNQEGNSIAFKSWNISLMSLISISTCAAITVFVYLVLSHSFNQEKLAVAFGKILFLHKLRNLTNPNILSFCIAKRFIGLSELLVWRTNFLKNVR